MDRALIGIALALGSACTRSESIGGPLCTEPGGCDASVEAGPALPIGDASYPDFDRDAYEHMASTITGTWYGLTWRLEAFGPPFEMKFEPEEPGAGRGRFRVVCLESTPCVPFGAFETPEQGTGDYTLTYVDSQRVGEGELSWTNGFTRTMRFRNALLQGEDQIFSFYVDFVAGTVQVVMTRDAWPLQDGGTPTDAATQSGLTDGGL